MIKSALISKVLSKIGSPASVLVAVGDVLISFSPRSNDFALGHGGNLHRVQEQ